MRTNLFSFLVAAFFVVHPGNAGAQQQMADELTGTEVNRRLAESGTPAGRFMMHVIFDSTYRRPLLAIPVAAGVFYNSLGWSLQPEVSALLMSVSSIIVAVNAVSLRRAKI